MVQYIRFVVVTLILISCGTSSKKIASSEALNKIITENSFEVKLRSAQPRLTNSYAEVVNSGLLPPGSNAGQIIITGDGNYFRKQKDSVFAYLPFFGERQMGGGYGNVNGGIEFKGAPEDLEMIANNRGGYDINFSINDKNYHTENYKVYIKLHNNLNASIVISSSQRTGIRYSGKVKSYYKKSTVGS